jgi:hypothetical protein
MKLTDFKKWYKKNIDYHGESVNAFMDYRENMFYLKAFF